MKLVEKFNEIAELAGVNPIQPQEVFGLSGREELLANQEAAQPTPTQWAKWYAHKSNKEAWIEAQEAAQIDEDNRRLDHDNYN